MRTSASGILVAVTLAAAAGCASTQRPVLYPNAALERAGRAQAERDIDDCMRRAESHGLSPTGSTRVVRRGAEGAATVVIPARSGTRSLLFVKGRPVASNAAAMDALSFERKGDTTVVRLGDTERYEIPDALLSGG